MNDPNFEIFIIIVVSFFLALVLTTVGQTSRLRTMHMISVVDITHVPTAEIIAELLDRYDVTITLQEGFY